VAQGNAQIAKILAGELPEGAKDATAAVLDVLKNMPIFAAAAAAANFPPGELRTAALRSVALRWTREDENTTLAWAASLPETDAQTLLKGLLGVSPGAFGDLAAPEVAAGYLSLLENPGDRSKAASAVAMRMTRAGNSEGALELLTQFASAEDLQKTLAFIFTSLTKPPVEATTLPGGVIRSTFSFYKPDLDSAVALLDKVTDPALRATAIASMANGWTKTDLGGALAWAQKLPDADAMARTGALQSIVLVWAKNDPAAALAFVNASADPSIYAVDAPVLASNLAKSSPDAALAFVQNLPGGSSRDLALSNVLVQMSASDFSSAWNLAGALPPGPGQDGALASLMGTQAKRDPAQAATLLAQIPAGPLLEASTQAVVSTWLRQDPSAASAWINDLAPGAQRNTAVVELVAAQAGKDPIGALNWATTLTDTALRDDNLKRVLTVWMGKDFAGALQWAQTANLPPNLRSGLLQSMRQQGAVSLAEK